MAVWQEYCTKHQKLSKLWRKSPDAIAYALTHALITKDRHQGFPLPCGKEKSKGKEEESSVTLDPEVIGEMTHDFLHVT